MSVQPFFARAKAGYAATPMARGPWDERFLHGGPPSALLLHEMTRAVRDAASVSFAVARLTTDFLRPVPLGTLSVVVDTPVGGRTVQRVSAALCAGDDVVMRASALFARQDEKLGAERAVRPGFDDAPWPSPASLAAFDFPFFSSDVGYHRAVDVRLVDAPWGSTPVRCWAKPIAALVDDQPASAEEAVVILADAESGMGPPSDPMKTTYLNPDLTVYFARRPQCGYIGLDIRSYTGDAAIGLSESELRDAEGVFGQSAQSLVLAPRR